MSVDKLYTNSPPHYVTTISMRFPQYVQQVIPTELTSNYGTIFALHIYINILGHIY